MMGKLHPSPSYRFYERIRGCHERCPFCHEECDGVANHPGDHHCEYHRPRCLGNYRYPDTGLMCLGTCHYYIGSDIEFRSPETGWKPWPYKEYRSIRQYRDWYIHGNNSAEATAYWKWFLCKYADKIATYFGQGMTVDTDVNEWRHYSWTQARNSL